MSPGGISFDVKHNKFQHRNWLRHQIKTRTHTRNDTFLGICAY